MFKFELGLFVAISSDPDLDSEKGLVKPTSFHIARKGYETLDVGSHEIGRFTFVPMPGCCGVVISTASYLAPNWRGKGNGNTFHQIKEGIAKKFGYSLMIATVQTSNFPEIIGAANSNWKYIHSFRNKRTTNDIAVMVKDI